MNNFTKAELEAILLCVCHASWIYKEDKNIVIHKLQSMINPPCEHKDTNYDDGLYYCSDCGVFVK